MDEELKNMYTAKIVSDSRPFLCKEGNTWVANAVYLKNGEFYSREVQSPSIEYGPFQIGEEIKIESQESDLIAEKWMIEVYKSPSSFKTIMAEKRDKEFEEEDYLWEQEHRGDKITRVIVSLLIAAIIGILLITIINS